MQFTSETPIKAMDAFYNEMRAALKLAPAGKAKDKAAAMARIEKLRPEFEKLKAAEKPKAEKKPRAPKATDGAKKIGTSAHRKFFNYDVDTKVKSPNRNGTKFAQLVELLLDGATVKELIAFTMRHSHEATETTKEMADTNRAEKNRRLAEDPSADISDVGFCTTTEYRMWKDLNNLAKRHGYGMRWNGGASDKVQLFETKAAQAEWDAAHGRS